MSKRQRFYSSDTKGSRVGATMIRGGNVMLGTNLYRKDRNKYSPRNQKPEKKYSKAYWAFWTFCNIVNAVMFLWAIKILVG